MRPCRPCSRRTRRFMSEVIAPLNWSGDTQPGGWSDGKVTTSPGFRAAFRSFAEAGWQGIQHPTEFGGQGLPKVVGAACMEMMQSANLSFALCPLLTDGAIEALLVAGSDEQKQAYLPRLIDGTWTGTMNLTEPQAGSDLAQVRTRAEPQADGSYRLFGRRSSSPTVTTTWPRTSCTSCWRARRRRRRASRASRCSSCRRSCSTRTARSASATTSTAPRSSTSSASRRARPACCSTATTRARSGPERSVI